ncbi:hypothetical protein DBR17_08350 [Sphingomonas sp. HMWF008]|nr:hypothetical protein DBR17_08350 [Sphingomonas sp. HMWF008]
MVDKRSDFPNRVRAHRTAQGLTLETLGRRVGLSTQMIGFIERGKREQTLKQLQDIALALGLKVSDLLIPDDCDFGISEDERALLDSYRLLDPISKIALFNLVRDLARRGDQLKS